jgi:hypothetical protein
MIWILLILMLTAIALWSIVKSEKTKDLRIDYAHAEMDRKYALRFFRMADAELVKEAIIATLKDDSYCRNYSEKEVNPEMMRFAKHIHLKGSSILGDRVNTVMKDWKLEKKRNPKGKMIIGHKDASKRKKK